MDDNNAKFNLKDMNIGDKLEETELHRIVLDDRLAEIAGEYLKKDGKDNYTTEIVAEQTLLLRLRAASRHRAT